MKDNSDLINQLLFKLEKLVKRQEDLSQDIGKLWFEINALKTAGKLQADPTAKKTQTAETPAMSHEVPLAASEASVTSPPIEAESPRPAQEQPRLQTEAAAPRPLVPPVARPTKEKSDLEKFIGENLINKIGIVITIIGVAIGAKYSIENNLISPLTRIVLGYLAGLGLLGFGIKLKAKYENFSAVLVSGAMAILYFITFAAYSFYGLIPQIPAFVLMAVFTAFTVFAALNYNMQLIAHIGLVGAYAVPFLLSDGSGNALALFSYMSIINAGILVIAFKKRWKLLYYSAFILSWLIYLLWYAFDYQEHLHFELALFFLSVFFVLFYLTFLGHKLLQKEKLAAGDILVLLANSFLFYGIGYALLAKGETSSQLLGLFTLGNGLIHFIAGVLIYRRKSADRNLVYLVAGLVLTFITIAVPVQLNGNWVTLIWVAEAALLFWMGRTKAVAVFEKLSYPLLLLALISLVQDWISDYTLYESVEGNWFVPLFSVSFLGSLLFIVAVSFINWLNFNKKYTPPFAAPSWQFKTLSASLAALLLVVVYYAFRLEIANYWNQAYSNSIIRLATDDPDYPELRWNYDLHHFRAVWIINYSLFFASLLAFVNFVKLKNRNLGLLNLALLAVAILVFLTQGLYTLSELRISYMQRGLPVFYERGMFNLGIRYLSYAFVALALYCCYRYVRTMFTQKPFKLGLGLVLHGSLLWMASAELIHWMDLLGSAESYKLGLSILWGVYSLLLIVLGIWKKSKPLRICAIALFGLTLVKLFFYDITELDTISKTIVFVLLGVLLLITSFLYQKYKHIINDGPTN